MSPLPFSYQLTTIMAGSIKFFQTFQKVQQFLGICSSVPGEKRRIFSITSKRAIVLVGNTVYLLPAVAYIAFEAKSIFDYGMAGFQSIVAITSSAVYLLFIWKLENSSKYIECCERFISKSKCRFEKKKNKLVVVHTQCNHTFW